MSKKSWILLKFECKKRQQFGTLGVEWLIVPAARFVTISTQGRV